MLEDNEEATDIAHPLVGMVDGEVRMEYKDDGVVVASDARIEEFLPPLQSCSLIVVGVVSCEFSAPGGLLLCNKPSTPRDTIDTS